MEPPWYSTPVYNLTPIILSTYGFPCPMPWVPERVHIPRGPQSADNYAKYNSKKTTDYKSSMDFFLMLLRHIIISVSVNSALYYSIHSTKILISDIYSSLQTNTRWGPLSIQCYSSVWSVYLPLVVNGYGEEKSPSTEGLECNWPVANCFDKLKLSAIKILKSLSCVGIVKHAWISFIFDNFRDFVTGSKGNFINVGYTAVDGYKFIRNIHETPNPTNACRTWRVLLDLYTSSYKLYMGVYMKHSILQYRMHAERTRCLDLHIVIMQTPYGIYETINATNALAYKTDVMCRHICGLHIIS